MLTLEQLKDRVAPRYHESLSERLYKSESPYSIKSMLLRHTSHKVITSSSNIITIGSCFAQEVRKWLLENQYKVAPEIWGVVYNTHQFLQILEQATLGKLWESEELFWVVKNRYYFPYLKAPDHSGPLLIGESEHEALDGLDKLYELSRNLIMSSDVLVFTLGMTEIWRNISTKRVYFAQPGSTHAFGWRDVFNESLHEFHNMTFIETYEVLLKATKLLFELNPKINLILSVSPVPLHLTYRNDTSVYLANSYSKAMCHAAALSVSESSSQIHYMPSFEIVKANPVGAYLSDGRHITKEAVGRIMEVFSKLFVETEHTFRGL